MWFPAWLSLRFFIHWTDFIKWPPGVGLEGTIIAYFLGKLVWLFQGTFSRSCLFSYLFWGHYLRTKINIWFSRYGFSKYFMYLWLYLIFLLVIILTLNPWRKAEYEYFSQCVPKWTSHLFIQALPYVGSSISIIGLPGSPFLGQSLLTQEVLFLNAESI